MTNSEVLLTLFLFGLGYWVVARLFERYRTNKRHPDHLLPGAGEQDGQGGQKRKDEE